MRPVPGRSRRVAALAAAAMIVALGAWAGASSTPATGQVTPVQAPGSAQTTANANPTAALSGIVVDAVTKRPVAGAVYRWATLDDAEPVGADGFRRRGRFLSDSQTLKGLPLRAAIRLLNPYGWRGRISH